MTVQPQTQIATASRTDASPVLGVSVDRIARQLLDHAHMHAWVKDADGRYLWVNDRYATLLGWEPDDCVGRRTEQLLPRLQHGAAAVAAHDDGERTSHRRVLLDGAPLRVTEVLDVGSGTRHLSGFVFPVPADDGTRLVAGAFTDDTDFESLRRRYADTIELYQDLFAHAGVALAVLDRNGTVVQANQECRRITDRTEDELVGSPFWSIARVDHAPGMRSTFHEVGSGLNRLSTEVILERTSGHALRARVTVARMPNRAGGRVGALMSITSPRRERSDIGQQLRPIEREILCQVAAGATTAKVAASTHLSRQGVDYNLRTLMERFDACNRAELVARAYAVGVLAPAVWPPRLTGEQPTQGEPARSTRP